MNEVRRRAKSRLVIVLRRTGLLSPALDARASVRRGMREIHHARREPKFRRRVDPMADGHSVVRHGRHLRLAKTVTSIRLIDVIEENLGAAIDLVERAGVEYFLVPIDNPSRMRIGVALDDLDRLAETAMQMADVPPHRYIAPSRDRRGEAVPLTAVQRDSWLAQARRSAAWSVFHCYASPSSQGFVGEENGCEIEFWRTARSALDDNPATDADEFVGTVVIDPDSGELAENGPARAGERELRSRRANPVTHAFHPDRATADAVDIGDRKVTTYREFAVYMNYLRPSFPIDVVYTWVDDADPEWQQRRTEALGGAGRINIDAASPSRFANRDELRYSLRSLYQCADFVRHVYLVTDSQVPQWLSECAEVTVVDHRDIFGDASVLPVFNSHAIESQLHHIDGLSEHYLYLNDDVFFGRRVTSDMFFTSAGQSLFFPSKARVPIGPPSDDEPAVTSAGKNGRGLLAAALGYPVVYKLKHTPHPQLRSVMSEMERRFPDDFARVAANRFRSHSDISVAASLHHHYAHATGRALPGRLRYQYVNLAADRLGERLERLAEGGFDSWCLNDFEVDARHSGRVAETLQAFLRAAFPYPSPFEREPDQG